MHLDVFRLRLSVLAGDPSTALEARRGISRFVISASLRAVVEEPCDEVSLPSFCTDGMGYIPACSTLTSD